MANAKTAPAATHQSKDTPHLARRLNIKEHRVRVRAMLEVQETLGSEMRRGSGESGNLGSSGGGSKRSRWVRYALTFARFLARGAVATTGAFFSAAGKAAWDWLLLALRRPPN